MSLSVESYWPLLLAPAVLFLFWVRRRTETSLSGRHLAALTLVRSAVALMLLVTLMRPHLHRPSKDVSAVFAVDVSRSIAPEFLSAAIPWAADVLAQLDQRFADGGAVEFQSRASHAIDTVIEGFEITREQLKKEEERAVRGDDDWLMSWKSNYLRECAREKYESSRTIDGAEAGR